MAAMPQPDKEPDKIIARPAKRGVMMEVPLDVVQIDHDYQRDFRTEHAEKIASKWNESLVGLPLLSRRKSGALFCIHGQHRVAAAKLVGKTHLIFEVLDGLTPAQEAEMRLQGNVGLADTAMDKFKVKVKAGHKDARAIVGICTEFDTQVNTSLNLTTGINAVAALESVYNIDKGITLAEVFGVIRDAWGEVGGPRATSQILRGIAWFLRAHGNPDEKGRVEYDRARLIEQIKLDGPAGLDRKSRVMRASMGGAMWVNYYRAVVDVYNERLGEASKLKWKTGNWTKLGGGGSGGDSSWN